MVRQGDVLLVRLERMPESAAIARELPAEPLGVPLAPSFGDTRTHIVVTTPELYRPEVDQSDDAIGDGGPSLRESALDVMTRVRGLTRMMSTVPPGPAARMYEGPPSTDPFADDESPGDDEREGALFLQITRPTILRHHEHRPILLEVGVYEVRHQQAFLGERRGWTLVGD